MSGELRTAAETLIKEFGVHSSGTARNALMLADAYLDEHRVDDDASVTPEWLDAVIDGDGALRWLFDTFPVQTRGDVRLVFRGLRIELKEPDDG